MARMLPLLSASDVDQFPPGRQAEAAVYRALETLPPEVVVVYSVATLVRNGHLHEGEADFVVLWPDRGLLVLEVKGGGIAFDGQANAWTSIDRTGRRHGIKDPFGQASARKHDLRRLLAARPDWPPAVTLGHAVCFPDVARSDLAALQLPHTPAEIVAGKDDLVGFAGWVSASLDAYRKPTDLPMGALGCAEAIDVLRKDVTVDVPRGVRLAAQESERIRLTEQQAATLEVIADRDAALVSGGAGTGKTVLALLEARRRASHGEQVLLVCCNQLLGAYLARACARLPIKVMTLHELYEWWVTIASADIGVNLMTRAEKRHPGADRTKVALPAAFCDAVERKRPPSFTSVIFDEGQDLSVEDWTAIEQLRQAIKPRFLVFRDNNQQLWLKTDYEPIDAEPFCLRRNCRNTDPVHTSVYRYYAGPPTSPAGIGGDDPQVVVGVDRAHQAAAIAKLVEDAIRAGSQPTEIAVLVLALDDFKSVYLAALPPLDTSLGARWGLSRHDHRGEVLVESVARYKGLEATIVILWVGDDVDAAVHREWLYVGMSRAKSLLYIVGTEAACREAQRA